MTLVVSQRATTGARHLGRCIRIGRLQQEGVHATCGQGRMVARSGTRSAHAPAVCRGWAGLLRWFDDNSAQPRLVRVAFHAVDETLVALMTLAGIGERRDEASGEIDVRESQQSSVGRPRFARTCRTQVSGVPRRLGNLSAADWTELQFDPPKKSQVSGSIQHKMVTLFAENRVVIPDAHPTGRHRRDSGDAPLAMFVVPRTLAECEST
jgi:hypothetical protein